MKEFTDIAETPEELAQIRYFMSFVHAFTIDYLFALRKVLPTLKREYGNLTDEDKKAMTSFISKLDMRMTTIFFNSLKYLDPISSQLITEELELYDSVSKEIADEAAGEEWKNAGKLNPLKKSSNDLGEADRKELEQLMQSLSSKKKRPPTASEGNPQQSEKKEEEAEKPKDGKSKKSDKLDDKEKESFLKQLGDAFLEGFNAAQEPPKKPRKRRKKDSGDEKKED